MAKVNVAQEIVDNHSTEEVIAYITGALKMNSTLTTEGVENQNAYQMGCAFCNVDWALSFLEALNEKLNGKKEPTVV